MEHRAATVRGLRLHYLEAGSGEPVLLYPEGVLELNGPPPRALPFDRSHLRSVIAAREFQFDAQAERGTNRILVEPFGQTFQLGLVRRLTGGVGEAGTHLLA